MSNSCFITLEGEVIRFGAIPFSNDPPVSLRSPEFSRAAKAKVGREEAAQKQ